jgi:hypothetical protein
MNAISSAPPNRPEHGMYLSQAGIYENVARDRRPIMWRTREGSFCRHIVGPILEFASPFPGAFTHSSCRYFCQVGSSFPPSAWNIDSRQLIVEERLWVGVFDQVHVTGTRYIGQANTG